MLKCERAKEEDKTKLGVQKSIPRTNIELD